MTDLYENSTWIIQCPLMFSSEESERHILKSKWKLVCKYALIQHLSRRISISLFLTYLSSIISVSHRWFGLFEVVATVTPYLFCQQKDWTSIARHTNKAKMRLTCEAHIDFRKTARPTRKLGAATLTIRADIRDKSLYNLVLSTKKETECGCYK